MSKRSYTQFCGLAKALDMVGERWTLLVVRNLLLGPLRYSELLRGLPGITTNLLAKRLKEMEENGLVERVRLSASDAGRAYRLTDLGRGLEPAVHALGSWGWNWMGRPMPEEHRNVEWLLVALRRRYRGGASLRVELVIGETPYRVVLEEDRAEIGRGPVGDADLRVRGPAMVLARLFLEGLEPGAAVPQELELDGGEDRLRRLLGAFERGDRRIG